MSDDDFLIDDEIYALATTGDKKRKKRPSDGKGSARKRARTDLGTSDMDESDVEPTNPYPLEGKYKDSADRATLNEMPEMQREEILAQRQEEMQSIMDKMNLSKMLANQREGGGMADDSVAQAAKRKRTLTGSAKEKAHTRDALKANRKAREERRAHHTTGTNSSPAKSRRRGSASSDMDTSSDEEAEPSQRESKYRENKYKEEKDVKPVEKLNVAELGRIQLTRTQLSKECMKPWFEEYVKGAWVRYLIGNKGSESVYRICEVKGISSHPVQAYPLENESVNQQLELAFGKSVRQFNMDKVSNSPFTEREFHRLVVTCEQERVTLPTMTHVQRKRDAIKTFEARTLTETDVSKMISRRKALKPQGMSLQQRIAEGSRLRQEYNTARARNDKLEAARLRDELEAFNNLHGLTDNVGGGSGSDTERGGGALRRVGSEPNLGGRSLSAGSLGAGGGGLKREGSGGDSILEELSKRNRQLNHENARRLQVQEAERRRRAISERVKKEEEAKNAAANPSTTLWSKEQEVLERKPELAGKDIGTKMAHMIEIDIPDF